MRLITKFKIRRLKNFYVITSIIFLFFFGIGQVTPLIVAGATAQNLKKFLELRKFSQIIPTLSGLFLVSLGLLNLFSNWI